MASHLRLTATAVLALGLAGMFAACSPKSSSSSVAATPDAPVSAGPGPAIVGTPSNGGAPMDVNKYAEQLEHNPALFEKQKQICHNAGPSFQPPELQAPCAAWENARLKLEEQRVDRESTVKNTDSL